VLLIKLQQIETMSIAVDTGQY